MSQALLLWPPRAGISSGSHTVLTSGTGAEPPSLHLKAEARGDVNLGEDFLLIHESSPLALQGNNPLFEAFSSAMR